MKKLFLACAFMFIAHAASAQSGPSVGILKIETSQDVSSVLNITPTFLNYSPTDQPVIVEVSITDNYVESMAANKDILTSEVVDARLVIPQNTKDFKKTYAYPLPVLPKKSTYKVEVRILDLNKQILFLKQGKAITIGDDTTLNTSLFSIQSRLEVADGKFGLQDGPIVKPENKDLSFYVAEIRNASNASVTISASEYSSRKYAASGSEWQVGVNADVVTVIEKGKTGSVKVPVRYFEDTGTFEGKIDLYAEQGGKKAFLKTDEFRYMIGDAFVTVTDAVVGSTTLDLSISKSIFDSTIFLTQEMTDEYLNSSTSLAQIAAQDRKRYVFTFEYKDANGELIKSQEEKLLWSDIATTSSFTVGVSESERDEIAQIEVSIKDDAGRPVFKNVFPVQPAPESKASMSIQTISVIVGLVLFVLSLAAYLITRRKAWIAFVVLFLVATLFMKLTNVFAVTQGFSYGDLEVSTFDDGTSPSAGCSNHGYSGLTMTAVSVPYLPLEMPNGEVDEQYQCGHTYNIWYDPKNGTCSNTPMNTYFYVDNFQTKGVTVTNTQISPNGDPAVFTYGREPRTTNPSYRKPIMAKINDGFTGDAKLVGYYYQSNGQCSGSTGYVTFTFKNVQCSQNCTCSGRDKVCTTAGVVATTTGDVSCRLRANCFVTVAGDKKSVKFTTVVSHNLGAVTYKDGTTGETVTNPVTLTIPDGGTVTQNTVITDAFDGMSAAASCSASATSTTVIVDGCKPGDLTCVITNDASILKFKASPSIVNQGAQCKFEWQTTGMSICSLKINGSSVAVPGNGTAATGVVAETADGNNKNGLLTCTTSGIPVRTVTATSTCRVNPEFRQQ